MKKIVAIDDNAAIECIDGKLSLLKSKEEVSVKILTYAGTELTIRTLQ